MSAQPVQEHDRDHPAEILRVRFEGRLGRLREAV
jgi:hypothetical protein